jgi:hypothetical protein
VKGCSAAAGAGSRGQRKGRWARLASASPQLVIFGAKSELSFDSILPPLPRRLRVTYIVASTQDQARAPPNEWARARDPSVKGQRGFLESLAHETCGSCHPSPITRHREDAQ